MSELVPYERVEGPEAEKSAELLSPQERLRLNNKMQTELAIHFYGFKDNDKMLEWIEKYRAGFRVLADRCKEAGGTDLIALYKTNPAKALSLAEEELYAGRAAH